MTAGRDVELPCVVENIGNYKVRGGQLQGGGGTTRGGELQGEGGGGRGLWGF